MKKIIFYILLGVAGLFLGCAGHYSDSSSGSLATVTYVRHMNNHYFSQETGSVVSPDEKETFSGPLISTEFRPTFSTAIYRYKTVECSGRPATMGRLETKNSQEVPLTLSVPAGVPLANSYRTKFKTCERECYKFFYTSSVFVPEEGAHYEVTVEPIDGVTVFKIENGEKIKMTSISKLPDGCRF